MFNKFLYICNCIVVIAAFICVTYAAIVFSKWGLLFFYLIPMGMYGSMFDNVYQNDDENCD